MQSTISNYSDLEVYLFAQKDNDASTVKLFETQLFERMKGKQSLGNDYFSSGVRLGTIKNNNIDP